MRLQLIRNATIILEYADLRILIDPMLGPKHSIGSFGGTERNPTVNLPLDPLEVLKNVDLLLLSHLHQDHFDKTAQILIEQSIPILCQPGDQEKIGAHGFNNVLVLEEETKWQNVTISRTAGQHGTGKWGKRLNPVSGFIFQFPGEPVLYWIGDSIWCDDVENSLEIHQPDVVVTHSGGAEIDDSGPIIMDAAQTIRVCESVPSATVIATHLEALDHCLTTRSSLRADAKKMDIRSGRLIIPENGDIVDVYT